MMINIVRFTLVTNARESIPEERQYIEVKEA